MTGKHMRPSWRASGLSPEEIQLQAVQTQLKLSHAAAEYAPEGYDGHDLDSTARDQMTVAVMKLLRARAALQQDLPEDGLPQQHPWAALGALEVDARALAEKLSTWQSAIRTLYESINRLKQAVPQWQPTSLSLTRIPAVVQALQALLDPDDDLLWEYLPQLKGEHLRLSRECIDDFLRMVSYTLPLQHSTLSPWQLADAELALRHASAAEMLRKHFKPSLSIDQVEAWMAQLKAATPLLENLQLTQDKLEAHWPQEHRPQQLCSLAGLRWLSQLLQLSMGMPINVLRRRDPCQLSAGFAEALEQLEQELEPLLEQRQQLSRHFDLNQIPDLQSLEDIRNRLSGVARLGIGAREAKDELLAFAAEGDPPLQLMIRELKALCQWREASDRLTHNAAYQRKLGKLFDGVNTDIAAGHALQTWARRIRASFEDQGEAVTTAFWALPDSVVMLLRSCHQQHHAALDELLSTHDELLPSLADNGAMKQLTQDLRDPKRGVAAVHAELQQALDSIVGLPRDGERPLAALLADLDAHSKLCDEHPAWLERRAKHDLFPRLEMEVYGSFSCEAMLRKAISTLDMADHIAAVPAPAIQDALREQASVEQFQRIRGLCTALQAALQAEQQASEDFFKLAGCERQHWLGQAPTTPRQRFEINQQRLKQIRGLPRLLAWRQACHQMQELGLGKLAEAINQGSIPAEQAVDTLHAAIFQLLASEIRSASAR